MSSPQIVMYARERFCPDVTRARHFLSENDIPWLEFDIEANERARAEMIQLTGRQNVPTVVIGDRILVEPSTFELKEAVLAAGFDLDDDA